MNADGWRHVHPFTPLVRGGLVLVVVIGIVIANLRDELIEGVFGGGDSGDRGFVDLWNFLLGQGLILAVIGAFLGLVVLVVLLSWLSWHFRTYRITEQAVENREGVLFKKHRRAPLERIQSVNLQRSLVPRLLGLTKIEVNTAGQGGKVELAYLGHAQAKEVRGQILRAVSRTHQDAGGEQPEGSAPLDQDAPSVSYDGTAYAPATDVITRRAQDFVDFDIDAGARGSGVLVAVPFGRLIGSLALSTEMFVMVVALSIIIIVASVIGSPAALVGLIPLVIAAVSILFAHFNTGFNFTLTRSTDGVRTAAGLTSTNTETLPLGRIHAIEALQPFGWRLCGWWRVRINVAGHSVGSGGQNASKNIVLPVGRADDVLRVLEALHPGITADGGAALRDALDGAGSGFTKAGRRAGAVLWFGRRRAGVTLDRTSDDDLGTTFRVRRGAVTRSLIIMPMLRAQSVQLHRPFWHRVLGLASIQVHTVLGPVRVEMRGLALADARDRFDQLARAVVAVQGADAERGAERHEAGEAAR